MKLAKVISGGQTGVDQAALRAAKAAGIPTGGWIPRRFLTDDGCEPWLGDDYELIETHFGDYPNRTRANVIDCDCCLWIGDPKSPGGKLTIGFCKDCGRPTFVAESGVGASPEVIAAWIDNLKPNIYTGRLVLLVAGNREKTNTGIMAKAEAFLTELFRLIRDGE